MMLLDTVRTLVNQYPGGRAAIALRLNKSDEVLRKELAGTSPQHKMGLSDAQQIIEILGEQGIDCSIFRAAVDAACGDPEAKRAACLHMLAANGGKEVSDVIAEVATSLADGNLSDNDVKRISKEVNEAIASLTALHGAVHARHAQDNPRRRGE